MKTPTLWAIYYPSNESYYSSVGEKNEYSTNASYVDPLRHAIRVWCSKEEVLAEIAERGESDYAWAEEVDPHNQPCDGYENLFLAE